MGFPASLAGSRVLNLGSLSPEDRDRFEDLGAAEVIEGTSPPDHGPAPPGGFDFIHCGALPVDGGQLLLLSELWRLAAPGASLLLGSRVLDEVDASRYLSVKATPASDLEWIPGRLALRWMVECSGFDLLHWFPEGPDLPQPAEPCAHLIARRSDRMPVFPEQAGSPLPELFTPAASPLESGEQLEQSAARLGPWVQGPFSLGGDLRIEGQMRSDLNWETIASELPPDLGGARVLDLGCNAGYNSFMLAARGAEYVLGCESSRFIEQARFLEGIYGSGVDFQATAWQQLEPQSQGRFDVVHCAGILHRELDPAGLMARLRELTAPGGTLLLGSTMLADPTMAELVRFVPRGHDGDREWRWVPGALALTAIAEAAGFEVSHRFGEVPGPRGEFDTISGYLRATRRKTYV